LPGFRPVRYQVVLPVAVAVAVAGPNHFFFRLVFPLDALSHRGHPEGLADRDDAIELSARNRRTLIQERSKNDSRALPLQ